MTFSPDIPPSLLAEDAERLDAIAAGGVERADIALANGLEDLPLAYVKAEGIVFAEQVVLGGLMQAPEMWGPVSALLIAMDFGNPEHQEIFKAIRELAEAKEVHDPVTVGLHLQSSGRFKDGLAYCSRITRQTATPAHAEVYARVVRDHSHARQTLEAARALATDVEKGEVSVSEALGAHRQRLVPLTADVEATRAPRRNIIDWGALEGRDPPPREWWVDEWLSPDPTLIAGKGGAGKTLLVQTIATALALGRDFIGPVSGPRRVLFWACEDSMEELWRRQVAICAYFGVRLSDLRGKMFLDARKGMENELFASVMGRMGWTPLREELAAQCNDFGADVLFMDNIGQTFGGNENDRHEATMYMNGLAGLVRGRPFCPVALGHPARSKDSEFSGSGAWENAARMRWWLGYDMPDKEPDEEPQEDPLVRYLAKRKQNYSVKDYRKLVWRNGLFVPESAAAPRFTELYGTGQRKQDATNAVIEGIRKLAAIDQHGRAAPSSPVYLPKRLLEMKLARGCTRKELQEALNALLLAERVKEVEIGKGVNRSRAKVGLVVTADEAPEVTV